MKQGIERNPDQSHAQYFLAPLYRYGGYGITKDETKAFEILKNLVTEDGEGQFLCELSLYYRNGIGVNADSEKADKWLKLYKAANPDKECKYADFSFMIDQKTIDAQKALINELETP